MPDKHFTDHKKWLKQEDYPICSSPKRSYNSNVNGYALIKKGVLVSPYTDKKTASMFKPMASFWRWI